MRLSFLASCLALFLCGATSVAYAGCEDPVVDQVGVISDANKVAAAARRLGNLGADVRVYTVRSFQSAGVANLDEYMLKIQRSCPSWQSGGHRKSTMLVIMIHPAKYVDEVRDGKKVMLTPSSLDAGVYFGVQHEAKLTPTWVKVRNDALLPAMKAYMNGEKDAYTKGFVSMLDSFGEILKAPTTSSGSGPTTIVRQEAGDWSWFGRMVIGVMVIVAAGFIIVFFVRKRGDASVAKGVQSETRRVRSLCLNRLIGITDPTKVAELTAMVDASTARLSPGDASALKSALDAFMRQGRDALAAFGRFDSADKDDPNVDGLPASTYRANQQAYEDIVAGSIEPAEESLSTITGLLERAHQARVA